MTVDEIYDNANKVVIPVGLGAWVPKKLEKKWEDYNYIPENIKAINAEVLKARKEKEKEKEALEFAEMYFG